MRKSFLLLMIMIICIIIGNDCFVDVVATKLWIIYIMRHMKCEEPHTQNGPCVVVLPHMFIQLIFFCVWQCLYEDEGTLYNQPFLEYFCNFRTKVITVIRHYNVTIWNYTYPIFYVFLKNGKESVLRKEPAPSIERKIVEHLLVQRTDKSKTAQWRPIIIIHFCSQKEKKNLVTMLDVDDSTLK